MGYTAFTKQLVENIIVEYNPEDVLDLGSQNNYDQPNLPAPYISEWYDLKNIRYTCIDLNGENNAIQIDLGDPPLDIRMHGTFDLVVDAGTQEHIGRDGHFEWEAIYNCWKVKHISLRKGGVMVNENPQTESWPSHGFSYFTISFYKKLIEYADYEILGIGTHAACGNTTDGWNVFCVMKKTGEQFPSLEEFKTLDLRQS